MFCVWTILVAKNSLVTFCGQSAPSHVSFYFCGRLTPLGWPFQSESSPCLSVFRQQDLLGAVAVGPLPRPLIHPGALGLFRGRYGQVTRVGVDSSPGQLTMKVGIQKEVLGRLFSTAPGSSCQLSEALSLLICRQVQLVEA